MTASPEQLHELLTYCIDFARTMLEDSADFYPFGATLSLSGEVAAVGGDTGEERPNPKDVYHLLSGGFAELAAKREIAGAALAANVNIPGEYESPSRDGLRVHLECGGYARFIYVPYSVTREGPFKRKNIATFYEPFAVEIKPALFKE